MMAWQSRRSFTTWGLEEGKGERREGKGERREGKGERREGDKDLSATSTLLHVHWRASLQGDHLRLIGLQNKLVWDDLKQWLLQVWRPPLGALCERTKK